MELTSYSVEMVNHNSATLVMPTHTVFWPFHQVSLLYDLTPPTGTEPSTGPCTNNSWEIGKVRDLFSY